MEKLTTEELKEQAIRQRASGDSYIAIGRYLESAGASKEEISEVIKHVDFMEKEKLLTPTSYRKGISFQSGFIGSVLIFLGLILTWMLWGYGWISASPIIMIGAGLMAFSGTFDN